MFIRDLYSGKVIASGSSSRKLLSYLFIHLFSSNEATYVYGVSFKAILLGERGRGGPSSSSIDKMEEEKILSCSSITSFTANNESPNDSEVFLH